jgi:phenylacetate-CoA ligase
MSIEDNLYFLLNMYKKMPDWLKVLLAKPFSYVPREFYLGKFYKHFYEENIKSLKMSHVEIEEYQFKKLKALISYCYSNVPYYKTEWDKRYIDLSSIKTITDFNERIPFLTRSDIRDSNNLLLSREFISNKRLPVNSGGSTGAPLNLYYLKGYTRIAERANWSFLRSLHGIKSSSRLCRLRGDYIGNKKIYSFDPYRNTLILSSFSLKKNNAQFYVDLLREFKVEYLYGYPASIITLINYLDKKPKEVIKGVILGSENVYEWQVDLIKDFFGINLVLKGYGSAESGTIAANEPDNTNYFFLPTHGYVEFIETDYHVDSDPNVKEIVTTGFTNPLMPLIRYKTQDYCIIDPCKKWAEKYPYLQISNIIGREQEIAIGINNERITLTALVFGRHCDYFNHILQMQVFNTKPGFLTVKIVPKKTFTNNHLNEIIGSLSEKEGMPFTTNVILTENIDHQQNGKIKFLVREF